MKDGICPKCGSNEVYKEFSSSVFVVFKRFRSSVPVNYICADCGYMEWYIEKRDELELMRNNWKRANPKHKRKNDE